jgi:hypothetical protein
MAKACAGANKVEVRHAGGADMFDRVVMATHSDTARQLRGDDISPVEAAVLDAIPYSYSKVYLHTGGYLRLSSSSCIRIQMELISLLLFSCKHRFVVLLSCALSALLSFLLFILLSLSSTLCAPSHIVFAWSCQCSVSVLHLLLPASPVAEGIRS